MTLHMTNIPIARRAVRRLRSHIRSNRLLAPVNIATTCKIGGTRFRVPLLGGLGLSLRRISEPEMLPLVTELLSKRTGTFLDVGANIGQTLILVKRADASREYIGFEPDPTAVTYMRRLIELNRWVNCVSVPVALGSCMALGELSGQGYADAGNSLLTFDSQPKVTGTVLVLPGDLVIDLLDLHGVSVIKIDVEGYEIPVLAGLTGTIRRFRPPIIVEVLPPRPGLAEPENSRRFETAYGIGSFADRERYGAFPLLESGELGTKADLKVPRPPKVKAATDSLNYVLLPD